MARWQDAFAIGEEVEFHECGKWWVKATIVRKTATGQPEVRVMGHYNGKDKPAVPRHYGNGQLRKSDLRKLVKS